MIRKKIEKNRGKQKFKFIPTQKIKIMGILNDTNNPRRKKNIDRPPFL
jgi:hypothetical protein